MPVKIFFSTKGVALYLVALNFLTSGLDNVHILGYRSDSQSIIASSDVLVVPSKENESFGLTIIEAMALSTPVIATKVGGMKEVITDNSDGILVDYGDVVKMKNSIISVIEDNKYRISLIKSANLSFSSKYLAERMALNYKNLICKDSKL